MIIMNSHADDFPKPWIPRVQRPNRLRSYLDPWPRRCRRDAHIPYVPGAAGAAGVPREATCWRVSSSPVEKLGSTGKRIITLQPSDHDFEICFAALPWHQNETNKCCRPTNTREAWPSGGLIGGLFGLRILQVFGLFREVRHPPGPG